VMFFLFHFQKKKKNKGKETVKFKQVEIHRALTELPYSSA